MLAAESQINSKILYFGQRINLNITHPYTDRGSIVGQS